MELHDFHQISMTNNWWHPYLRIEKCGIETGRLLSDPMYHLLSLSKALNPPQSRTPARQLYETHVVSPQCRELLGVQALDQAL